MLQVCDAEVAFSVGLYLYNLAKNGKRQVGYFDKAVDQRPIEIYFLFLAFLAGSSLC